MNTYLSNQLQFNSIRKQEQATAKSKLMARLNARRSTKTSAPGSVTPADPTTSAVQPDSTPPPPEEESLATLANRTTALLAHDSPSDPESALPLLRLAFNLIEKTYYPPKPPSSAQSPNTPPPLKPSFGDDEAPIKQLYTNYQKYSTWRETKDLKNNLNYQPHLQDHTTPFPFINPNNPNPKSNLPPMTQILLTTFNNHSHRLNNLLSYLPLLGKDRHQIVVSSNDSLPTLCCASDSSKIELRDVILNLPCLPSLHMVYFHNNDNQHLKESCNNEEMSKTRLCFRERGSIDGRKGYMTVSSIEYLNKEVDLNNPAVVRQNVAVTLTCCEGEDLLKCIFNSLITVIYGEGCEVNFEVLRQMGFETDVKGVTILEGLKAVRDVQYFVVGKKEGGIDLEIIEDLGGRESKGIPSVIQDAIEGGAKSYHLR
ncbi:hypothetical protein TrLO_g691 [Triparma laevis f. longispina]|uniref:Uncharacterized protein n=1 Tax=Triparma laevis f. longispina TaxID=1714387 RepID=A0A9W7FQU9_9STRA|nr:hypothetical protein TrLO_g691 [Triparma laevis f. longispina]